MYERFYGLCEKPFNLTPDPEFLFLTPRHKEALDRIAYGIMRREGFTLILGDVGTGKTTLCWALLGRLEGNVRTALVLNPMLSEEDLIRSILQDFGVRKSGETSENRAAIPSGAPDIYDPGWMQGLTKKELLDELNRFLLTRAAEDVFCVLVVDEAQNLSVHALEQLRMLSNLETAKKKLLQIIFVGQLEFDETLKSARLKSLNQRIAIRHRIFPLSRKETGDYIYHRLRVAKAPDELGFSRGALRKIYRYSGGYPRLINLTCDRALLAGYSERSHWITGSMVRKAIRGLRGREDFKPSRSRAARFLVPIAAILLIGLLAAAFLMALRWKNPILMRLGNGPGLGVAVAEPPRGVENASSSLPADVPAQNADEPPRAAGEPSPAPSDPAPNGPDPVRSADEAVPSSAAALQASPERPQPIDAQPPSAPSDSGAGVSASQYVIQVHSLTSQELADRAVSQLRRQGFEAFSTADGRWYVVMVGPFDDPKLAEQARSLISRRHSATPIVRRLVGL